jgi:hypothetical protein
MRVGLEAGGTGHLFPQPGKIVLIDYITVLTSSADVGG